MIDQRVWVNVEFAAKIAEKSAQIMDETHKDRIIMFYSIKTVQNQRRTVWSQHIFVLTEILFGIANNVIGGA